MKETKDKQYTNLEKTEIMQKNKKQTKKHTEENGKNKQKIPLLNWYLQRVSTNQEKIAICKRDENQKNCRKMC